MAKSPHVIETRQKTDLLFQVLASISSGAQDLLAASATFSSPVRLVSGYGAINFLLISNVAFTLRVQESNESDGPWTQSLSQASAADPVTGTQFICLQVAPCGAYMRVFVDNGAVAQNTFSLAGAGLPVAGGAGGSSGGGTASVVQIRDGSGGAVLAGVNAAGQLLVSPLANRASFEDNQQTVPVPGTAVQLQTQAIPDGFTVWVAALDDNTGNVYFGNSAADAQNHTKANVLQAGAFRLLAVTNVDAIWIDADVAGEGVQWLVEI